MMTYQRRHGSVSYPIHMELAYVRFHLFNGAPWAGVIALTIALATIIALIA